MEPDSLRQGFLLISMVILMFGIGTGLKIDDFTRLLTTPRAATIGLLGQLVLLPLLGLLCTHLFALPPLLAAGVILLCACPGGLVSNMLSLLARADVALSVTLTTASTLLAALTLPVWLMIADTGLSASPLESAVRITGLTLVPTL
ncbi:MAG: BASS family bile acid:Na+ symporter, partial [Myxococcota bacterium]